MIPQDHSQKAATRGPSSDSPGLASRVRRGEPRGWGPVLALLLAAIWLWPMPLGLLEPWSGRAVLPHALEDGVAEGYSRAAWELDAARRSWLGDGSLLRPQGTTPFPVGSTQFERHHLLASLLSLPTGWVGSATWRLLMLALGVGALSWWATRRALRLLGADPLGAWWGASLYVLAPWFVARLELGPAGLAWPWLPLAVGVLAQRSEELAAGNRSGTWRHGAVLGVWLGLALLTSWSVAWSTLSGVIAAGVGLAWQRRAGVGRMAHGRGTAPWASWPLAAAAAGALAFPLVAASGQPLDALSASDWTRLEEPLDSASDSSALAGTPSWTWLNPWRAARLHPATRAEAPNASLGFRSTLPYRELSLGWGVLTLALWSARARRGRALALGGVVLVGLGLMGGERIVFANTAWIELWPAANFLLIGAASLGLKTLTASARGPKVVLAVAAVLAWLEFLPAPLPTVRGALPVYAHALAELPGDGAVLQLPWTAQPSSALLAQTAHRRPLFCAPLSSRTDRDWKPLAGLERVIERYPSFASLLSGQALAEPGDLAIDLTRADVDVLVARRSWLREHPDLWDLIDRIDGWATEESPMWVLWYRAPSGFELNGFVSEGSAVFEGESG